MPPSDTKYVTANRPANQRTTPPSDATTQAIHPIVKGRMAALKAKHQFGIPLADQIRRSRGKSKPETVSTAMIFSTVLIITSCSALVMAIGKSTIITGISVSGLLIGLGSLYRAIQTKRIAHNLSLHKQPIFDEASLTAFDQVLEQIGQELEEDTVAQLKCIKSQILRIAKLTDHANVNDYFSMEDRQYLSESLRRYLPDSLQSYLQVPVAARATKMLNTDHTANDLLRQQLTILQSEFDKREQNLIQSAAEHLLRQQRFLEAKTKGK